MEERTGDEKDRREVFHAWCPIGEWERWRPTNSQMVEGMEDVRTAMAMVCKNFLEDYSAIGWHRTRTGKGLSASQTRYTFQKLSGYVSRWKTIDFLPSCDMPRLWCKSQLMQAHP